MPAFDARLSRKLKDVLADPSMGPQLIDYFCEASVRELAATNTLGDDFLSYFTHVVRQRSFDASSVIYKHAESPIERVFLGSIVLLFLKSDPLAFLFTPPCSDAPRQIRAAKEDHGRVTGWVSAFTSGRHGSDGKSFADWLNDLEEAADLPIPHRDRLETQAILTLVGFFKAYHFTPQAGFPSTGPTGRSSRVDLLAWHPERAGQGLIVECDGYQFHHDKSAFQRDRQRDRSFLRQGYQVIRYAGSEIVNHPTESAGDLYDHLLQSDDRV